jgi:hypothetical protein
MAPNEDDAVHACTAVGWDSLRVPLVKTLPAVR